ncbi:unnamed protein product [Rotaria sp. Silwood1]|nr:unnamed protein product [Rotaria sp. Silwood1]CAF3522080.1 unnamed protein product [Rotaria sp. Silwood1]CAF3631994.1 unnamed protein product [Rotaria sp. Silwood1]CAF4536193.1 unnamed protein product [Rotaria sp. Silwood1]CAF4569432.1 unnamed protein product [Rotaria sp. Silwood1]
MSTDSNQALSNNSQQQHENNSSTIPIENNGENNSTQIAIENQNENNLSTTPINNTSENNLSSKAIENQKEENSSTTISIENNDENNLSSKIIENQNEESSSTTSTKTKDENNTSEIFIEKEDKNQLNTDINHTNSRMSSRKMTQSHSSKTSERSPSPKTTNEIINQRPLSPITRHRIDKQQNFKSTNQQRTRSNSPRKTFSYITPDGFNLRYWKQQRRQLAKQEEDNRIYHENRIKLERLARIAKEPSSYPSIHVEQERLRERHTIDYRRKLLKSHIPILRENLSIVHRLANVRGVYDVNKMNEDYARHTLILKQDAANRQKVRETATQRPFILPKINVKS